MGALTDNRKRFSDNFSLSPALASPYLPNPEYAVNLPPLKKPRITSMPSVPDKPRSSQASGSSISRLGQFPPPQPLSRTVHAPQRCSKFSRSAIPLKAPQKESNQSGGGMGIFKSLAGTVNRFLTGRGHADTKGLSKEEYKKLVEVRQGHSVFSEHVRSDVWPGLKVPDSDFRPSSSTVVSDSTVLIEKAEKGKEVIDLTNSVNHVEMEMEMWTERQPVYKELYESVKKRDLKLISLDFEVKITEQKISAFGIASRLEDVARDAFVPLTDEEEDLVGHALFGPNRREVLVAHESSNIEITRQILQCLGSGAWLNDEVINLYLELLKEREKREPKKFLKCHFFNTFFYKKLVSGVKGYDFKAVRRWTTQKKIGYGLIECDKIFVPIHKDVHWCLAIINVKDEKFQYLDSLGGRDTEVLRVLARYFVDEVKEKSHKDVDVSSWKQDFVDDLPEQQNGYDCGMFMIKYADFYSRGLGLCFNQGHMPYFRKRAAKEILRLKAE